MIISPTHRKLLRSPWTIFTAYFILAYVFFFYGISIFDTILAPGDGYIQGFPSKIFASSLSLWNPFVQSGTFSIKDVGNQAVYLPGILLMNLFPNALGYNLLLLLHYTMAGYFTHLFLYRLTANRTAAFVSGICFMFCGFMTAHKGHHSMIMAAAWLPVVLYCIEASIQMNSYRYLLLSAMAFSQSILADYPAVSMYIFMVAFPYTAFRIWTDEKNVQLSGISKIKTLAVNSLMIFFGGALLCAVELVPVIESLKHITRQKISYDFFSLYSFPLRAIPLLLFPFYYGTHSPGFYKTIYHGPWNLTEIAGYAGILPLLFSVIAFILWRKDDRQIRFWSYVVMIGFLLVLGRSTPLNRVLYHVPIYNMFRAPTRNWLEVNFAIAVLTGYSVHHILSMRTDDSCRFARWIGRTSLMLGIFAAGILGAIALFHTFIPRLDPAKVRRYFITNDFPFTPSEAISLFVDNTKVTSPSIYIPIVVITISIIMFNSLRRFYNKKPFFLLVAGFIFLDLYSFGHFHDNAYPNPIYREKNDNAIYNFLKNSESNLKNYRVLPLEMNDHELYPLLNSIYGFNVVNGYGPIWLKEYSDITQFEANGQSRNYRFLLHNSTILSMLSTKYIITADPQKKAYIESIFSDNGKHRDIPIVCSLSQNGWNFHSPFSLDRKANSVVLRSRESSNPSLIQFEFNPLKNTNYRISFNSRIKSVSPQPLVVDFWSHGYESLDQRVYVAFTRPTAGFEPVTMVINSGPDAPASAYVRFLTASTADIELKDIKLEQAELGVFYKGGNVHRTGPLPLYRKRFETVDGIAIYENMNFMPRARFVDTVRIVGNFSNIARILRTDPDFDPASTALFEQNIQVPILEPGFVVKTDFSDYDVVRLKVKTGQNSFLILSDAWYPGWRVFVDGLEREIIKTDGTLMGVFIEGKGEHDVEFKFRPLSFYWGLFVSIVSFICFTVALLFKKGFLLASAPGADVSTK